jgi:hypothetical protein
MISIGLTALSILFTVLPQTYHNNYMAVLATGKERPHKYEVALSEEVKLLISGKDKLGPVSQLLEEAW